MAKKKVTHQEKTQNKSHEEVKEDHQVSAMEEVSEKLESLKTLNSMLLKETVEKRQQVDSLVQAKGFLESELEKSNSEKHELESELTRLGESAVKLELEKNLVAVFVSVQVGQHADAIERERDGFLSEKAESEKKMKRLEREVRDVLKDKGLIEKAKNEKESEIQSLNKRFNALSIEIASEKGVSDKVRKEKDEMKANLDVQIEETNGLRVKLIESERREKEIQVEAGLLKVEYDGLLDGMVKKDNEIQSLVKEKESAAKSILDSSKVIEKLQGQIDGIVREKEGIEKLRNEDVRQNGELQNTVSTLNETVLSLQGEEAKLRQNLAELEKKYLAGLEKEKATEKKIEELVKGNKQREVEVESLIEEKGIVTNELDLTLKLLDDERKKIEKTVREKIEMEEAKVRRETEMVELQKQVAEFKDAISKLEVSSKGQKETIKNLESEVGRCKAEFEKVSLEKDKTQKGFEEEKQNGLNMKEKIQEMEKQLQKILEEAEQTKADYLNVVVEKKKLDDLHQLLKNEIVSVQTALAKAQNDLSAMQSNLDLANSNSEQILTALRNAADSICSEDEQPNGVKQVNGEDFLSYAAYLEAIKNVIKSKENKVEAMKKEVVFLQSSVAEANQKKNIWAMLSSATSLFAAISVAYLARGH